MIGDKMIYTGLVSVTFRKLEPREIIDLVIKLRYEEGLLCAHYTQYADYKTRSKRLIPVIW